MNESEQKMLAIQKKLLLHARIKTGILLILALMLIISTVSLTKASNSIKSVSETAEKVIGRTDFDRLTTAADSLGKAAEELQKLDIDRFNEAASSFTLAAEKLADVDVDKLNKAMEAFSAAAETLKDLNIQELNGLVASLNNVSEALENVVSSIQNLFRR
ncbi:MAG: hypothetical protein IJL98_02120 [Lachnospiraceae bacterium]|nr:hypothetical protein [Lachnospiraceae bacterium]